MRDEHPWTASDEVRALWPGRSDEAFAARRYSASLLMTQRKEEHCRAPRGRTSERAVARRPCAQLVCRRRVTRLFAVTHAMAPHHGDRSDNWLTRMAGARSPHFAGRC